MGDSSSVGTEDVEEEGPISLKKKMPAWKQKVAQGIGCLPRRAVPKMGGPVPRHLPWQRGAGTPEDGARHSSLQTARL